MQSPCTAVRFTYHSIFFFAPMRNSSLCLYVPLSLNPANDTSCFSLPLLADYEDVRCSLALPQIRTGSSDRRDNEDASQRAESAFAQHSEYFECDIILSDFLSFVPFLL